MMKIYNVKKEQGRRSNRFCGPSAISALTNVDTADTAKALREYTGRRMITGVAEGDLLDVLLHNYNIDYQMQYWGGGEDTNKRPTLARWLKNTVKERSKGRVFLIVAGNHYQVISGRRYVCGITQTIVSIKDKQVKRRSRVKAVYEMLTANG
jgi:hypothetical protein